MKFEIQEFSGKKAIVENKTTVEGALNKAKNKLGKTLKNLEIKNKERQAIYLKLEKIKAALQPLESKIGGLKSDLNQFQGWENEFTEYAIITNENPIKKPVKELRNLLKKELREKDDQQRAKEKLFRKLQQQTNIFKTESPFIEEVEMELLTIKDKEVTIKELLETISNEFTVPVDNFLNHYEHFKGFIKNFNRKISKYKISDLESLRIVIKDNEKLLRDLGEIKNIKTVKDIGNTIDLFKTIDNSAQKQGLETLRKYIEDARPVQFLNMFDIELIAEDDMAQSKRIQLKKQNESTGTIRMINLMLFLSIIISLKKADDSNKLVFFVDEDVIDSNNMAQFIQFCKDNNFIVIFAAKHQIIGLEKYYNLKRYSSFGNKVFADERNVSYAQKK